MAKRRTERARRRTKAKARRRLEGPPPGLSKYAKKRQRSQPQEPARA